MSLFSSPNPGWSISALILGLGEKGFALMALWFDLCAACDQPVLSHSLTRRR
jgi:hypothetical protein